MTDVIVNTITDTVVVEIEGLTTVLTAAEQGPSGPNILSTASDVDATNKVEGSVLVYSAQNQKWVATTQLENQNVESGHY